MRSVCCVFALLLSLAGCADRVETEVPSSRTCRLIPFQGNHSVGQTFVARHGGLAGIDAYLQPPADRAAAIVLHLRENAWASQDLRVVSIHLEAGSPGGFHRFRFTPLPASSDQYYYAFLEAQAAGCMGLVSENRDAYLDGTFHEDHTPGQAQLVFRLCYGWPELAIAAARAGAVGGGYGLAVLVLLFFAGYGLVRQWTQRSGADFTTVLFLSVLAAWAAWLVLLVWLRELGIRMQSPPVWILTAGAGAAGAALFFHDRHCRRGRTFWLGGSPVQTLALWGVSLLAICLRLQAGMGMLMLPGSDTCHHTLIAQLFHEQGGIPNSYAPYAPLQSFSYHFGFHALVAYCRWLFGTDLLETVKIVALVLNGALAAAVGVVGGQLAGRRRAGVIAALLVGLVMVSPACLLRWGRFTQTAGLLFLAAGIWFLWEKEKNTGRMLGPLLLAGLLLCHGRVALFWAILALLTAGMMLWRRDRAAIRRLASQGGFALILIAPWLCRLCWIVYDPYRRRAFRTILPAYNDVLRLTQPVLNFPTNLPILLLSLAAAGLAWLAIRDPYLRSLAGWSLVLAVGGWAIFPLTGFYPWDLVTSWLTLAVPLGLLAGGVADSLWNRFRGRAGVLFRWGVVVALLAGGLTGWLRLPAIVREGKLHLRPGDRAAMAWIDSRVPGQARFATNATLVTWLPGWLMGNDGGCWIPLLAHRSVIPPLMLYPWEWADQERLGPALREYRRLFPPPGRLAPAAGDVLAGIGATHIFTYDGGRPFSPAILRADPRLRLVFHQDRAWIFALSPAKSIPNHGQLSKSGL